MDSISFHVATNRLKVSLYLTGPLVMLPEREFNNYLCLGRFCSSRNKKRSTVCVKKERKREKGMEDRRNIFSELMFSSSTKRNQ